MRSALRSRRQRRHATLEVEGERRGRRGRRDGLLAPHVDPALEWRDRRSGVRPPPRAAAAPFVSPEHPAREDEHRRDAQNDRDDWHRRAGRRCVGRCAAASGQLGRSGDAHLGLGTATTARASRALESVGAMADLRGHQRWPLRSRRTGEDLRGEGRVWRGVETACVGLAR